MTSMQRQELKTALGSVTEREGDLAVSDPDGAPEDRGDGPEEDLSEELKISKSTLPALAYPVSAGTSGELAGDWDRERDPVMAAVEASSSGRHVRS